MKNIAIQTSAVFALLSAAFVTNLLGAYSEQSKSIGKNGGRNNRRIHTSSTFQQQQQKTSEQQQRYHQKCSSHAFISQPQTKIQQQHLVQPISIPSNTLPITFPSSLDKPNQQQQRLHNGKTNISTKLSSTRTITTLGRRRHSRAPLVDSTLLRFLSSQAKLTRLSTRPDLIQQQQQRRRLFQLQQKNQHQQQSLKPQISSLSSSPFSVQTISTTASQNSSSIFVGINNSTTDKYESSSSSSSYDVSSVIQSMLESTFVDDVTNLISCNGCDTTTSTVILNGIENITFDKESFQTFETKLFDNKDVTLSNFTDSVEDQRLTDLTSTLTWIHEYDSQRVSDILLSRCSTVNTPSASTTTTTPVPPVLNCDVLDYQLAQRAAYSVQATALRRLSRQQTRSFFRYREQIWSSNSSAITNSVHNNDNHSLGNIIEDSRNDQSDPEFIRNSFMDDRFDNSDDGIQNGSPYSGINVEDNNKDAYSNGKEPSPNTIPIDKVLNSSPSVASFNVPHLSDGQKDPQQQHPLDDVIDVFLEYGLTMKDIAEILIHTPSIAFMKAKNTNNDPPIEAEQHSENDRTGDIIDGALKSPVGSNRESNNDSDTLQQTMDRAFVGLLLGPTLNLRKYDARKVLRNTPGLLTPKGSQSAVDVVAMFLQLNVSVNSLARDKNTLPKLLGRSPALLFRLVAFLASDAVRMPFHNIGPLLRRTECTSLLDAVAPVPWLSSDMKKNRYDGNGEALDSDMSIDAEDEDDDNDNFNNMDDSNNPIRSESEVWLRTCGTSRKYNIDAMYQRMTATAWTLRNEIGTVDLGKVIAAYPSVLLLDAEEQILPTARYLMHELQIWEDDLPRVLQLYPVLLGMDVHTMKRVVEYLVSIEVVPENLSIIFRSFPSLLTMDVERDMEPVVDFLTNYIGISNVGRFITRLPPVLGYSVVNELQPKWLYLQSISSNARFEVTKFPAVFSYPYERIKIRFDYLRDIKQIPKQIIPPFDQVLCYGDRDFATKIARDRDGGIAYQQFIRDRKDGREQQQQQEQQDEFLPQPNRDDSENPTDTTSIVSSSSETTTPTFSSEQKVEMNQPNSTAIEYKNKS